MIMGNSSLWVNNKIQIYRNIFEFSNGYTHFSYSDLGVPNNPKACIVQQNYEDGSVHTNFYSIQVSSHTANIYSRTKEGEYFEGSSGLTLIFFY